VAAAPAPDRERRNLAVLIALQALLSLGNACVITIGGLAGAALAGDPALATVPITGWVVGGALTTLGASLLMKRIGRRAGFTVGALVGVVGAAGSIAALVAARFWPYVGATAVLGAANAIGQYYRFAAADAAPPERRARAIAWVLAGGLLGGVLGPGVARYARDALATPFVGAYVALVVLLVATALVVQLLRLPAVAPAAADAPPRPMRVVAAQPAFVVALLASGLGFGVMNFLMTATPMAMSACGHPFADATTVIAWHIVGMYAPSFVTGALIKRVGIGAVLAAGVALNGACVAIALAGVDVAHFWAALVLLGVGWNFLYVGGTTLLTTTYRPAEGAAAQGLHDLVVFVVMAVSSSSSGLVFARGGWRDLNLVALPCLAAIALALAVLAARRHRPT
jgi:MFS family permease